MSTRKAFKACCPEHISHWHPNYTTAFEAAKDKTGKLHFSTVDISASLLPRFTERLRRRLHRFPEFEDFFFVTEYRGLKGQTSHDGAEAAGIYGAYDALTVDLNLDDINDNEWFVDIGLELHAPGKVLQWTEDAHGLLMEYLLPNLNRHNTRKLMKSSRWSTDTAALLYDLAGFRVPLGGHPDHDEIRYINVYTTDKGPTYQLHRGAFSYHKPLDVLPDAIHGLLKDVSQLMSIYRHCCYNAAGTQEGCTRLEIRVPLMAAYDRIRVFPRDLARDTVVALDARVWW